MPEIRLPVPLKHPVVACTPEELDRLRAAWRSKGPERNVVARVVSRADSALKREPEFPPRGGQHNQWYQCEKCQMGLRKVDDTHHKCPKCGKVYSGAPYDDVIFSKKHHRNLDDCRNCAWAYAVTGDKKYAERAKAVLLGYAQRYKKYPYHDSRCRTGNKASRSGARLFEQTLNEASAMPRNVAAPYDLIHDSGVLTGADHEKIRTGLIVPMLKNMDKHKAHKSNWQSWHNAGMLWGGAVIGDVSWVRKAVRQPLHGFTIQMNISITDDGMWYENSWGYHFYTLSALVQTAEGARRLGIDLWSHPKFQKMFTLPVHYTMANGRLPRFGDDVNSTATGKSSRFGPAYAANGDPGLLALLPAAPSWDSVMRGRDVAVKAELPELESRVFKSAGHAIMRAKGPAGLTAAFTFGPYGGFHGHFDKLSFVFFGLGRELGVDPGRARSQAYRLPIHRNWYKATPAHNCVVVDGASQEGVEGKLVNFSAADEFAFARASCDKAYKGVKHTRTLALTPSYLVVMDELVVDGAEPRRFDWVYHNRGEAVSCDAAAKAGKLPAPFQGAEYIRNVKRGRTDGETIRVEFSGKDVTTHLVMAGEPATEVAVGDGPLGSVMDRVPVVVVTRRGKAARFCAVIEPAKADAKPAVESVELSERGGALTVTVRRAGGTDVLSYTPGDRPAMICGGRKIFPVEQAGGR